MNLKDILAVLVTLLCTSHARVGFKKDVRMDNIDFPPKNARAQDGIPQGHLRPLGYQRRPDGKVMEVDSIPLPQDFHENYVLNFRPVVFRQLVKDVPAMELWTDDYLKKKFGELFIHVVVKKELLQTGPQRLKFRKFLKEYQYEDWYLSNTIPQEMMADLVLAPVLQCGMERYLVESEIWMSSGGTASLIHSHADHDLHCVLAGRKDFIMIKPDFADALHWQEHEPHPGAGFSPMDVDQMNMFADSQVSQVRWHWATLKQGDCMFIPAGYLHQVRSHGRSFSSTMMWSPVKNVSLTPGCSEADVNDHLPLSEVPIMWTYTHGDRELLNIKLNARSLRHHFDLIMRNEKSLRYDIFVDFFEEIMSEIDDHEDVDTLWAKMDPSKDLFISREDLDAIDDAILEEVAQALNKPNHSHNEEEPKAMKREEL